MARCGMVEIPPIRLPGAVRFDALAVCEAQVIRLPAWASSRTLGDVAGKFGFDIASLTILRAEIRQRGTVSPEFLITGVIFDPRSPSSFRLIDIHDTSLSTNGFLNHNQ